MQLTGDRDVGAVESHTVPLQPQSQVGRRTGGWACAAAKQPFETLAGRACASAGSTG